MIMVPDGMRRDEAFRKTDELRAIATCLADQPARLLGRSFLIEETAA
jgi:hypothetical protein